MCVHMVGLMSSGATESQDRAYDLIQVRNCHRRVKITHRCNDVTIVAAKGNFLGRTYQLS